MRKLLVVLIFFTALTSFAFSQTVVGEEEIFLDSDITLEQLIVNLEKLENIDVIKTGEQYLKYAAQSDRYGIIMARAYCSGNQLDKALEVLDMIPEKSKYTYFIRFLVYFLKFKYNEAEKILKEAELFASKDGDKELLTLIYSGFAELEIGRGKLSSADSYISKGLRIEPDNEYLTYVKHRLKYVKGEIDQVEKLLIEYEKTATPERFVYSYLAEIALRKNDLILAEKHLNKANEIGWKTGRLFCDGVASSIGYNVSSGKVLSVFEEFPFEINYEKLVQTFQDQLTSLEAGNFEKPIKFSREIIYIIQAYIDGKIKFSNDEIQVLLPIVYIMIPNLYILQREKPPENLFKLLDELNGKLLNTHPDEKIITDDFNIILGGIQDYINGNFDDSLDKFTNLEITADEKIYLEKLRSFLDNHLIYVFHRIVDSILKENPALLVRIYKNFTGKDIKIDEDFYSVKYTDDIIKTIDLTKYNKIIYNLLKIFIFTSKGDCMFELGQTKDALLSYAEARKINPVLFTKLRIEVNRRYANLNPENFFYSTGRDIADLFCEIALYYVRLDDIVNAKKVIGRGKSLFPNRTRIQFYSKYINSITEGGK